MKKILLFWVFCFFTPDSFAISLEKINKIQNYINILMEDSFSILDSQDMDLEQKISKASKSIAKNFDLKLMGQYALGINIRTISDSKLEQYISAYSQYMINNQSQIIKYYNGQKLSIVKVQEVNQGYYRVQTLLMRDNKAPISIDFYVSSIKENGKNIYKIYDIITENVSLAETQRAEYSSAIEMRGIDHLIQMLRAKTSNNHY